MDPFYTRDGKEVHSLPDMALALEQMSAEDFSHHVSKNNNDVAKWIRDVHQNSTLASALEKTTDKDQMIELIRGVQGAAFPQQEEYHPTDGVGKEDTNLHDSYNDENEWQAAKEAHHPGEDIANPAGNNLNNIANSLNNNEDNPETDEAPSELMDHRADPMSQDPVNVDQEPAVQPQPLPSDLSAPAAPVTMKDRIIFSLIGFIIGVLVGYGITFLF